jgi:tetratricopeptide (TPR) repeat protein
VGVLLAGATLVGAVVGYLQGVASDAGDAAAREARDESLLALTEHQRSNQWSTIQVEHWTEVLEQRARAAAARQASRYWATHGDTALADRMSEEADRRTALAQRTGLLTELSDTHPSGPQADPGFPDRFYASQGAATKQRVVLQDLANEASSRYGGIAASHVAVLATIAIAAYLLGLSLVLEQRRQRAVFAVVGTGLLAASVVAATWTELGSSRLPDAEQRQRIATAYARGSVTAQTARTAAEWEAAQAAYREALAVHPGLARAHVDLAGALFSAASPQRSGFASVSTPEAVRAAAAELQTARGLGWDDLSTRGDGGFYEMLLALAEPDGGHADRAVELTAGALELAPDLPVVHYNHAAALLTAGRVDDALAAYQAGIAVSTATSADGAPVFGEVARWDVASGALTDLELIGAAKRDDATIAAAIERIRTLIVAGLGDPITNTDPATQPVVSDLTLNALPSQLWWEARIEGLDAGRDAVSVVWSYEDPALPGRHVLASHTGPLRLGQSTNAGGLYVDGEAPAYWASRSYLLGSIPHQCLPDGSYRVELFINGRLAAEPVTRDLDEPELTTVSRPDMGLLFCRPADWVVGDQEDGARVSFRSADGSVGMTAYRIFRPIAGEDDPAQSTQVMGELMAAWPGQPRSLTSDPIPDYLMGLADTYVQWYDGPRGRVKLTAGVDSMGTVYAVALEGTAAWVDGSVANGILGSFTQQ